MPRLLGLVLFLAACSTPGSAAREADPRDETHGSEGPPPTGACVEGDLRRDDAGWDCACTLHYDQNCGGAPRELEPPAWGWSCAPTDPATDRGDGCPFGAPRAGDPCGAARACSYPDAGCGWTGTQAICDGTWRLEPYALDPPP